MVKDTCAKLKEDLQQIATMKINPAYILRPSCHATAILKAALMSDCLIPLKKGVAVIVDAMHRLEKRNEQVRQRLLTGIVNTVRPEDVTLRVHTDVSLSRPEATEQLAQGQSTAQDVRGPFPFDHLLSAVEFIQETNAMEKSYMYLGIGGECSFFVPLCFS